MTELDAPCALGLRSVNAVTGKPGGTWTFFLDEQPGGLTRLVIHHRYAPSQDSTERVVNANFEPIGFVMEHRMLLTLKELAEEK